MMQRMKLLLLLAAMPEEAFQWLVMTLAKIPGRGQVWPDGTGGFRPDSQASIAAVEKEAKHYVEHPPQ